MDPASCLLMAQYNRWMNARLYATVTKLSEHDLHADRGAYFGSVFGTLNHLAVADTIWLHRFAQHPALGWLQEALQATPAPTTLTQPMARSLAELQSYRERTDGLIDDLAARVTGEQLAATLRYANTAGQSQARNFGALLQHFYNHQTHHRGQTTTLLSQLGLDVGVTDLLAIIPSEA